jgi:organic hydroperoxide reductase OsmC/OhrA
MPTAAVALANIAGTEAAAGWAGAHTVVVDHPDGVAGGRGLGFNGAELLALAVGGCLCNDLRYAAHARGVGLGRIEVGVALDMAGDPLVATGATLTVDVETTDGTDPAAFVAAVHAASIAANSVSRGFPVTLQQPATAERDPA